VTGRAFGRAAALACAVFALAGCSHLVILHDPLTAPEHNDLGVAYESGGRPDLARREYRRALKLDPTLVRARVNLGNLEAAAGRWSKAEGQYRRALRDQPEDADALNNLAVALLRQHRGLEEARRLSERAVAAGGARDSIYRATLDEVRAAARQRDDP
jgi:Tfp pilus assembly protein PilF